MHDHAARRVPGRPPSCDPSEPTTAPGRLPAATRARMEHAFGADFSAVRIHEDDAALRAAYLAAAERSPLSADHLRRAVALEYQRAGKLGDGRIE